MTRFTWITLTFCGLLIGLGGAGNILPGYPGSLLVLLVLYLSSLVMGSFLPSLEFYLPIINRSRLTRRQVALTFDDGPDAEVSPGLLALLKTAQTPASFFYIGQAMESQRKIVQQAITDGHLLANHTYSHPANWGWLGRKKIEQEIEKANQILLKQFGYDPRFFRPPYSVTRPGLGKVLQQKQLTCIGWSVRGLEAWNPEPDQVVNRIMKKVRPGAIILLHEGYYQKTHFAPEKVVETVEKLIRALQARGYQLVRLDELLKTPPGPSL